MRKGAARNMTTKSGLALDAIGGAWAFWLEQHPVSVGEIIEQAVTKGVEKWLNAHEEEIVDAIAKQYCSVSAELLHEKVAG